MNTKHTANFICAIITQYLHQEMVVVKNVITLQLQTYTCYSVYQYNVKMDSSFQQVENVNRVLIIR